MSAHGLEIPQAGIHPQGGDQATDFPPHRSSRGPTKNDGPLTLGGKNFAIRLVDQPRAQDMPISQASAVTQSDSPLPPVPPNSYPHSPHHAQPRASYDQKENQSNVESISPRNISGGSHFAIPRKQPRIASGSSTGSEPRPTAGQSSTHQVTSSSELNMARREPRSRHVSQEGAPERDDGNEPSPPAMELAPPLQYHHRNQSDTSGMKKPVESSSNSGLHSAHVSPRNPNGLFSPSAPRPNSAYSALEFGSGRMSSPGLSPNPHGRLPSAQGRRSPDSRPKSFVDLLNVPYPQAAPAPINFNNAHLQHAVGSNASLLSTKQTLEMYRANVKKTNDQEIQYSFAIFMIEAAQEAFSNPHSPSNLGSSPEELFQEARQILQRLSDKGYPFAQYYLADGFASGIFNKGKSDNDKAFPLFISASKHGHAEAGYRAALCYEFGWGTRKDVLKAVQFYRQSASKNHPGAMTRLGRACLSGDLGLGGHDREGLKWLKRAAESADVQYNSAPYELGLLHETGYGEIVFKDEAYTAQLFTQSAELGHVEANFRLGEAYEYGSLSCPKDAALSVHFYNGAASQGHPEAMMALCAWYMVGAEPILPRDENEAYEWARRAAQYGLPKAEYALGYFTEFGIGCRRDPLEANVWYVRAAEQGEPRARTRIAAIRAAASGGPNSPTTTRKKKDKKQPQSNTAGVAPLEGEDAKTKGKKWGIF